MKIRLTILQRALMMNRRCGRDKVTRACLERCIGVGPFEKVLNLTKLDTAELDLIMGHILFTLEQTSCNRRIGATRKSLAKKLAQMARFRDTSAVDRLAKLAHRKGH